jgi:hypothetical protein
MNFKDFLPILATLLTAILAAVGVLLRDWLQKRDARHQRKEARLEATELISVIEKWMAAQQQICSSEEFEEVKQSVRRRLDRVYSSLVSSHDIKKPIERRPFIRRALLFYKPASLLGWILHTIFYVLAALILVWGIFSIISIYRPQIYQLDGQPLTLNEIVFIIILYWLLLLVPALAIRGWALYLDKRNLKRFERSAFASMNSQPNEFPFVLICSDEVECVLPHGTQSSSIKSFGDIVGLANWP